MTATENDVHSELHQALRRLIQAWVHPLWQRTRAQGLSMPQVFALRYIRHHERTNVSDLARSLGVTSAAVSQLLRRLVEQGYVVREEDLHDRRHKHLRLTTRGEEVLQAITPDNGATFNGVLSRLTSQEAQQVLTALELLLAKLPSDAPAAREKHPCEETTSTPDQKPDRMV